MKAIISAIVFTLLFLCFVGAEVNLKRAEEIFPSLINKMDSYTEEQIEECRQAFENLVSFFNSSDLSRINADLTQNFTNDHYALLAASTQDCAQLKKAYAAINSVLATRKIQSIKKQQQQQQHMLEVRGPWGHNEELVAPNYYGCSAGPMQTLRSILDVDIIKDEPKCESGPDGDADTLIHIAWEAVVLVDIFSDLICELAKAYCVSTVPPGPCVRLGAISCSLRMAQSLIVVAADKLCFKSGFHNQMLDDVMLGAAYRNSYTALNALRCKNVTQLRRTHGCNGQDENCDLVADDCGEDIFEPEMRLNYALVNSAPYFTDPAKAIEFAARAIQVEDDCTKKSKITISTPTLSGTCSNTVASITATDECGNVASIGVPLSLDTTPPTISCGVAVSEIVPDKYFPEFTTDVGFSISSEDDCGDAPKVSVTVFSTELSSTRDVFIKADKDGNYQSLEITSRFNNFQSGSGRVYTIFATATNKAGTTAVCSAKVNVHPRNLPLAPDTGATYLVAHL